MNRIGATARQRSVENPRLTVEHRGRDLVVPAPVVQRGERVPEIAADVGRVGAEGLGCGFVDCGHGSVGKDTDDSGAQCAEDVESCGG